MKSIDDWYTSAFRTSSSSLQLARVLFALYILLVGAHDFSWVSSLPSDFFHPPLGVMSVLSDFPAQWFLAALRYLTVLSAWFLLLGWRVFPSALTLGMCLVLSFGSAYCVGKITHNILFVLAPFALALLHRKTAHGSTTEPRWSALSLLALGLGFLMLTAALPKIVFGWLSPGSSAVYAYSLEAQLIRAPIAPNWLLRLTPWEALDWVTVVFELAFLPCAFRAAWFRPLCAIACLFHFTVLLTLDISFGSNLAAYALFFDWSRVANILRSSWFYRSSLPLLQALRPWHGVPLAAAYLWAIKTPPANILAHSLGIETRVAVFATGADVLLLFVGAILAAGYLARALFSYATPSATSN